MERRLLPLLGEWLHDRTELRCLSGAPTFSKFTFFLFFIETRKVQTLFLAVCTGFTECCGYLYV